MHFSYMISLIDSGLSVLPGMTCLNVSKEYSIDLRKLNVQKDR